MGMFRSELSFLETDESETLRGFQVTEYGVFFFKVFDCQIPINLFDISDLFLK